MYIDTVVLPQVRRVTAIPITWAGSLYLHPLRWLRHDSSAGTTFYNAAVHSGSVDLPIVQGRALQPVLWRSS